jgi:Rps23 Pro-64 3,4-dihydroxylase Tpa1-like proline 4-hydroxylase
MGLQRDSLVRGESAASLFFFDRNELVQRAKHLKGSYSTNAPFPSIVIDSFLPDAVAQQIYEEFPPPDFAGYQQPDNEYQKHKLGRVQESFFVGLHPFIRHMLNEFNGLAFIDFLEELTGIEGIIPDAHFKGGALHQILPGGRLAIHADFNRDARRQLDRRINVLVYFNPDWQEEWGGDLELWDTGMTRCATRIAPLFNRCAIFNTTSNSYHGHPEPLNCPQGQTRKSIALYYYTNGRDDGNSAVAHGTLWRDLPVPHGEP